MRIIKIFNNYDKENFYSDFFSVEFPSEASKEN